MNVQLADVTIPEFWYKIKIDEKKVKLIILAMPLVSQNIKAAQYLRSKGYSGTISSIAKYADDIEKLQDAGVDQAYQIYNQAGIGFAKSSKELLQKS